MRRALLFCAAIAFAIACGDSITEPMPDRTVATPPIAFATTTTEDGLSISTDKDDYAPGDTVHFTGSGWQAGDVLDIVLTDNPQTHDPLTWTVNVGEDGMFHDSTYVVDEGDLDVKFTLVATSRATGRSLTVQFTDSNINNGVTVTPTPQSVLVGGTANYTVTVPFGGNNTACTASLSISGLPTGAAATFNPTSVTGAANNTPKTSALSITTTASGPSATPPGDFTITVTASPGATCSGGSRTADAVLSVIGPATKLAFVQQPSDRTAGQAFSPALTVQTRDAADHLISTSTSITLAIDNNPGGGTLSGTLTQSAVAGVATFPGLSINKSGTGYTLRATSTGLADGISNAFNIAAGPFTQLGFTVQPGGGTAGVAFPQQPTVAAQDANGNTVTSGQGSAASITLAIQTNPSGGTLTCTTNPLGATNGVAAFAGCRINNAGNGYRLSATANVGGNTFTVNSDLFNVVANNAAPNAPATLAQFRSNGTTSIPTGGATNETSVVLKGVVSDPDAGNTVKLQVEVKPVGTAFADVATAESALLASGSTASVTVGSLVNGTSYHWQARAVDNNGAASAPWTSFGGNLESAADFSVDTDAPGVTINQAAAQADPTSGSTINFTVVFSKSVTGFATGDVTLSGTAGATTATVTGSGTTYNVAVSGMTTDGTVIATIAAGVATDAAGNANVASTSTDNTVTYDTTKPTVTINQAATQADPTNASPINFTVEFSEIVTGFATGDVTLSGTAGATTATVSGSGTTYNVAVTGMTTDGTVIATIGASVAIDAAGNANLASTSTDNSVTYDKTPPTVTINQAAAQTDPTSASPINFTVVFSEIVTDFATGDVTVSGTAGATIGTVTGSGTTYNVAVSDMTNGGTVIAAIGAGKATDAAGNGNTASTSTDNTVTYDPVPPVVSNVAVSPNPTNGTIAVTATAKVDDATTGNSKIVSAFYSIDGGAAVAMAASDGSFNSATENVTANIPAAVVAALTNGTHQVCVKGTDAAGNSSDFSDAGACATLTVDKEPPVVSNVAVSPSPTNGTIAVTATAHVTDATTGNSKIVSAFYSIDGGAAIAMAASDGSFSSATENVTATIPAAVVAALSNGTHQVCVKGTDAAGNTSSFADAGACATLTVDKEPPVVSNVAVDPNPTNGSIDVTATATVDDAATGNSDVVSAVYSIDGGPTHPMTASDGSFNSATENVTATIPAATVAALTNGNHTVCVRGTDAAGNTSLFTAADACTTLIIDKEPPVVSNVAVSPSPTNGTIAVTATAHVTDVTTGNSKIVSAYYSIDGAPEIAMAASDGSFSTATENVTATIPAAVVAALSNGNHQVCVKGTDAAGNTSSFADAGACATLTVDKVPPVVSNVAVTPNPTNGSIAVTATATVDDAATGNSDVVSAVYSIDGGATLYSMTASDGTFNSPTEDVRATIPAATVAALTNGSHTVCVQGTDAAGNTSLVVAATCTTLTIDKEPPVVSNVDAMPNPTNGSIAVTATAHVTDATTGNSKITSAYYKIDGAGEVAMAASDGSFNTATENVTATIPASTVVALSEGNHQVCVRGTDLAGNTSSYADAGACTTLVIDKTPPEVTINQKIGQADPTNASPINFTVVFNEIVTDFATGDVTLTGTGGATTATVTGSGTTYNVAVSGMHDGTVIATVAAGAAHDAAGNGNHLSTSTDNSVTYDITRPKVAINQAASQADPTNASTINFTVVFDETVNGFATGDVTLSGTAGATTATVTGSGTTYNVAVSGMTSNGTVIATVGANVASDPAGNLSEASTSTDNTVTYDTTPAAISNFNISPNPVAVNTPFTISATFTDALSFVTGAEYSLNGPTGSWTTLPAGSTAPYGDSKTENGSVTISRPDADVLNVCVRSTDQALNTNQVSGTNPIQCAFLAVYDPSAGFVTGGGWINSPAGAYVADASLVGKANFGFVSKYITQKDKTTPVLTGNTEFQFQAGSLNFSSTAYEWMVVSGTTKASYKGSGTVNGATGYGFLLSVVDGGSTGDRFRMKIWNKQNSAIVYDNQISAADDATASQLIAGGSIVIHTNGGLATK